MQAYYERQHNLKEISHGRHPVHSSIAVSTLHSFPVVTYEEIRSAYTKTDAFPRSQDEAEVMYGAKLANEQEHIEPNECAVQYPFDDCEIWAEGVGLDLSLQWC